MARVVFALVAALALGSVAVAQGTPSAGPGPAAGARPGGRGTGARVFDPATVTTVSGKIEAVDRVDGRRGQQGVHLRLQTADGPLDVHLGPAWYVDRQELKLAKDDAIVVTGSKIQLGGQPALIAQTVKKGDSSLTLRDAGGVPLWAGPRRK